MNNITDLAATTAAVIIDHGFEPGDKDGAWSMTFKLHDWVADVYDDGAWELREARSSQHVLAGINIGILKAHLVAKVPRRVLAIVCRVGRHPTIELVGVDLEWMQGVVGGPVERVLLEQGVYLWLNEEGRIQELPPNRSIRSSKGCVWPVFGDCFITSERECDDHEDGAELESLKVDQLVKWVSHLETAPQSA